ncbi:MAG TPA: class I SAM-dependent methyltransferase [Chloroflexi bacterium]|nr:class I SAM-dependent methyltransferase [Chloroflexota bacterium]
MRETGLAGRDDPYARLVRYYDVENADLVEDLAAYDRLVRRFGGPVLDVGCGTGRVAFHLAQQGVRVVGVDISRAMLTRAQERAARRRSVPSQPLWLQADVTTLALAERFGLAIFAYNGFMHFLDQGQQIRALERLRAHLKPGGGLVIDLPGPLEISQADDVASLVVERIFTDPDTGHTVIQQSLLSVNRATQIMDITWVYDSVGPGGSLRRDLIPLRLRYTTAPEMRLLLERVGLRPVELCGDYEFNPYQEESPRLFVIATRAD